MNFEFPITVLTVKQSKGEFDGKAYSSTKVTYFMPEQKVEEKTSNGNIKGFHVYEDKFKFEDYDRIIPQATYKGVFTLDTAMKNGVATQKLTLVDVKPIK